MESKEDAIAWLESEGMEERRQADAGGGFGIEVMLQHCQSLHDLIERTQEVERRARVERLEDFRIEFRLDFDGARIARVS